MASGIELSSGIVVDIDSGRAYVMAPEGGVSAIALGDGSTVWHSDAADKPLLLVEDLLLSQAGTSAPAAVPIRMLRVQESGAVASEGVVPLPGGVDPMLSPTAGRSFSVSAAPLDGDAMLRWEFRQRPLRGIADGPDEVLPNELFSDASLPASTPASMPDRSGATASTGETVVRGQVRLSLTDGAVQPMLEPFVEREAISVPQFAGRRLDITSEAPSLAREGSERFRSSDGRHELASTPVETADAVELYRWELFPAGGTEPIGNIELHVGFAPFVVSDRRLLVELQPYTRVTGGSITEEPMQLRAYDLSTGATLWSRPTRDIYAVPPPPS